MPYKILSLDGGGVFGSHSVAVLNRLNHACPGFIQGCDLIAGTSIGGIIALGLAKGVSTDALVDLFIRRAA